jgi:antitoxin MazE
MQITPAYPNFRDGPLSARSGPWRTAAMGLPDGSPVDSRLGYAPSIGTTRCVVTLSNRRALHGTCCIYIVDTTSNSSYYGDSVWAEEGFMRAIVKKWGNSAAVRIPSGIMQAARLTLDEVVDVREQDGHIVIEPMRLGKVDLAQLLAGITPENLHGGVDFGDPVGKESL